MFHITSSTLIGIEAVPVFIEAHVSFNMPSFHIVGLPDASVKESKERIRVAIKQSGFTFPRGRVTLNLAPADIRKQGPMYDLASATAILAATGQIHHQALNQSIVLGELALSGNVRPITGVLNSAVMAKRNGYKNIFIPRENTQEALAVKGLNVYPVGSLVEFVDHVLGTKNIEPAQRTEQTGQVSYTFDFQHIKGQELAKRGMEIAAAGAHNILLSGPPGTGKTLLAKSLPSILPELGYEESIGVTSIASVIGSLKSHQGLIRQRPFRTPHHSASAVSLIGGGAWPKPGEVSRAHRGVLFLDELPEFSRHVLEHLRQPLEDGHVTINRAHGSVSFPARFLLVASMNPCPCGFLTDPHSSCECTPGNINRYKKKLSGPLLDRFDLVVGVPRLESEKLLNREVGESSDQVRKRVTYARNIQTERFSKMRIFTNSEIPQSKLDEICPLSTDARNLIELALKKHQLTPRGFARVRKVARTIADLEGGGSIQVEHVAEALQFREQKKRV